MNDRQRVYSKVLTTLKKVLPTAKQCHVVTLAMMVTGIVIGKKAQLAAMSSEVPRPVQDKSSEKRFHRWVKNPKVGTTTYFLPFAAGLIAGLANHTLVLAMDGSPVGRGCQVLMVGVLYHKRMIPIAWVVYRGARGHASAAQHVGVLQQLLPLIPQGADVVLVADGEYDSTEMLQWVELETTWHFVVRSASDTLIYCEGEWLSLASLMVKKGHMIAIPEVLFTQSSAYGPLQAIAWWGHGQDGPLYLMTNMELAEEACHFYARRCRVETLFSDKKRRGFHIHQSHLSSPQRLANLLIATSLAYLWMVYLGVEVLRRDLKHLIDRRDRRDKSLFRLGMDWLKYLLKHDEPIPIQFHLPLLCPFTGNVR